MGDTFLKGANWTIGGEFMLASTSDNASSGTLSDVATLNVTNLRFTNASIITGLANPVQGKIVSIINASTGTIIIANNNSSSIASNRILTGISSDVPLMPDAIIDLQYDSVAARWRLLGGSGAVFHGKNETPSGVVDGSNRYFTLSEPPIQGTLIFFLNGIEVPPQNVTLVGQMVTLATAPVLGQIPKAYYLSTGGTFTSGSSTTTFIVDYPVVSGTDITNRYLVLSQTPATPSRVVLDIPTGSPQIYGTDFIIVGNHLSWNGLALDGQINIGDTLRVQYYS